MVIPRATTNDQAGPGGSGASANTGRRNSARGNIEAAADSIAIQPLSASKGGGPGLRRPYVARRSGETFKVTTSPVSAQL